MCGGEGEVVGSQRSKEEVEKQLLMKLSSSLVGGEWVHLGRCLHLKDQSWADLPEVTLGGCGPLLQLMSSQLPNFDVDLAAW